MYRKSLRCRTRTWDFDSAFKFGATLDKIARCTARAARYPGLL